MCLNQLQIGRLLPPLDPDSVLHFVELTLITLLHSTLLRAAETPAVLPVWPVSSSVSSAAVISADPPTALTAGL